jgi:hypothetical protein
METSYQPRPQAQVFKGMRRFRYYEPEHSLEDALRSPYVWWWRYLRMSKDYWWTCQRRGSVTDVRLRAMYADFGDVYAMPFADWWQRRGAELFVEQADLAKVRRLDATDLRLSRDVEEHLLLEVPVFMTEKTIIKQVRELLAKHENRTVERRSTAKRRLQQYKRFRSDIVEVARQTWRMAYESRDPSVDYKIGQVQGSKSLYQIGKELRLVRSCMPQPGDTIERTKKRVNGMKVGVSRMLTRCDNLIANASVGIFPSVKQLREPIQWGRGRRERMEEAIRAGLWRPLFEDDDVLNVP